MVEGARLESVYTPKGYHEFESHRLRKNKSARSGAFFVLSNKAILIKNTCFNIIVAISWHF